MAINLDPAANAKVSYGDIAALAGATALTVAFTVDVESVTSERRFVGQGGAFLVAITGGQRLGLLLQSPNYGFRTGNVFTVGNLFRCVCTWDSAKGDGDSMDFWINGVKQNEAVWVGGSNPASIVNSGSPVEVGRVGSVDGLDGVFQEIAIWTSVVPDGFAEAYGKGYAPSFYRTGGILYATLIDTSNAGLRDRWGRILGVNTLGTTAPHRGMIYPAAASQEMGHTVPPPHISPPHIDDGTVALRTGDDASVSIPAEDDSVSIRETEDATV